jgi:hypothetical protein
MTVNLPILTVALALLWIPRSWLRRGSTVLRSRHRSPRRSSWANPPKDGSSVGFGREFTKSRNYVDIARAWLGAVALVGGAGFDAALRVAQNAPASTAHRIFALQAAALLIGVLIQTVRYERNRLSLTAPIFYLAGISFALFTPFVGLCGFIIAWVLNPVAPSAQAFLIVQACIATAAGYFLNGITLLALLGFTLGIIPVVLSLLARRPLVVFSPRGFASSRGAEV